MKTKQTVPHGKLTEQLNWLRRVALELSDDPDDLVQSTAIARLTHTPRPEVPERAWLRRVLTNFHRTGWRSTTRRARWEAVAEAREASTPEALLARAQITRAISRLIFALPEEQRDVVLLRYFEDLTSTEIAERLSTTPGTVRWRLKEALSELRTKLDDEHGGNRSAWLDALVPAMLPKTPANLIGLLGAKVLTLSAWAAVVVAFGVASGRPIAPMVTVAHADAAKPSSVAPPPRVSNAHNFGSVPSVDPASARAPVSAPAGTSAAVAAAVPTAHAPGSDADEADSDQLAIRRELRAMNLEARHCLANHAEIDKVTMVYLELRVVARGGVGRAVDVNIVPPPPEPDPRLLRFADVDACVLDLVRAHAFAAPSHGDVKTDGYVGILRPAGARSPASNPEPKEEIQRALETYRKSMTQFVDLCAKRAGDLPPTSPGIIRVIGSHDAKTINVQLIPSAGEQQFPGVEECIEKMLTPSIAALLEHGESLDLPFDAPPTRN
jgi:RNA polymerase sigma-70 factor (ECF subfamily)